MNYKSMIMKNLYRVVLMLLLVFPFAKAIGGNIYGQITNSNTLAPISNKMVYLYGDTINIYYDSVLTDTSGYFHFQNVPAMQAYSHYYVKVYDCNNIISVNQIDSLDAVSNFSICQNISCLANFTYNVDTSNQSIIHFFNTSLGSPTTFLWNFGDNSTSTSQNPTHTYSNYGSYIVTLTISGNNCNSSKYDTVIVGPSCIANFGYQVNISNPLQISFFDSSSTNITGFFWTFGDGTNSTLKNPVHTYTQAGTYNVNLYAYSSYCSSSKTISITVNNPCQANFNYLQDSINLNTYHFYNTSIGNPTNYLWNFGDNTTSTQQNPTHTYNSSGLYLVTLTITGTSCSSSYFDSVLISALCQANYIYTIDTINQLSVHFTDVSTGNPTSWTWNFGDGLSSSLQNPTHQYATGGNYTITLSISGGGCNSSFSDTLFLSNSSGGLLIFAFADTNRYDDGTALLYSYNTTNQSINLQTAVTCTNISGYPVFNFSGISPGFYKVKIIVPDTNSVFAGFYNTWYGNTFSWQLADTIYVSAGSTTVKTINLVKNNVLLPQGNGIISGSLQSNTGPVQQVDVYLLKNDSSIIQHTKTDNSGLFNFAQLPYGNYIVYPELAGFFTQSAQIILSQSQPSQEGISFMIQSGIISVGIENTDIQKNNFTISPNPFDNFIILHSCISENSKEHICILDLQGKEMFSVEVFVEYGQNMEIDLSGLPSGMYILQISSETHSFSKKLIKH